MKNTEAYFLWLSKIDELGKLLSDSSIKMNDYMYHTDAKERQINYVTIENMDKRFKESKEAIEFIKGRIYSYFPVSKEVK